ncbi:MAG TPA: hypothetical protein V6D11_31795 [Waterburya sp.]|jgi:hypothetical protein
MSINWEYLTERIRRYNSNPSDDLLYRIGTHVDVLTIDDCRLIEHKEGCLTPEQRYRVLDWIVSCQNDVDIDKDLALLIFGKEQLTQWLQTSRRAYPNFEFYLCFEYQDIKNTGWESGINFTMHWHPQPGAPMPETETDFPWRSFWDSGEMFWGNYPGGTTNHFDFNLYCYPNETSFTKPGWICEEGDRYTMVDERDADLMSVAQVLQHFAVPA